MQMSPETRYAFAWIALVVISVITIWFTVQRLEMVEAALSPRHSDYAIPVSISKLRGLPDYTAYMEVATWFQHHKQRPIAENILEASRVPILNPDYRLFVSGDDKGLVDLVYISFELFGSSVASIFVLVAVLANVSIALYVFQFCRSAQKMALLVASLASFYVILFTFGITDQSTSIIEPRFIGFLGIVPLLHVVLTILDTRRLNLWSAVSATIQLAILMFVVHLRTSEMWQVLCILAACTTALLLKRDRRAALGAIAIIAVLGAATVAYRAQTYHRAYQTTDLMTRVLWHNAVMGLSVNQAIRDRFAMIPLEDATVTEAVRAHLSKTDQAEILKSLFSDPNYTGGNFAGFRWSAYEPKAREFYFHIVNEMPLEVLKTYFVLMPRIFIANLSYMSGYPIFQDSLWKGGTFETPEQRAQCQHYLNPLRPFALLVVGFAAILLAANAKPLDWSVAVAAALAIAGSAIPPVLVMPVFQYSQLMIMLVLTGCYLVLSFALAAGMRRLATASQTKVL